MIYRCKNLGIFDEDQITNLYKQVSARKWRTKEPLDDEMPIEQPRLLKRAVGLVLDAGRKAADEICSDLQISRFLIEQMCNLPLGSLAVGNTVEFQPTLK
jgi:hypothetical protein